jgi:hypothetical protein
VARAEEAEYREHERAHEPARELCPDLRFHCVRQIINILLVSKKLDQSRPDEPNRLLQYLPARRFADDSCS